MKLGGQIKMKKIDTKRYSSIKYNERLKELKSTYYIVTLYNNMFLMLHTLQEYDSPVFF